MGKGMDFMVETDACVDPQGFENLAGLDSFRFGNFVLPDSK